MFPLAIFLFYWCIWVGKNQKKKQLFHEEQLKTVKKTMEEKDLHKGLKPFIDCKDHTVSGDWFEVMKNEEFDLLVTSPSPLDMDEYYESDRYISHTDSKKTILDNIYQIVKKQMLKKKLHLINSFETEGKTILDVGAGTGDFLAFCKKNDWTVFGTEPNKKARSLAKNKGINLKDSLEYYNGTRFDIVTLWHVLEHVKDVQKTIAQLKNTLKPNGVLLVAVPNYKSYDALYYKENWAAFDVPRHLWHFSQKSIELLFEEEFLDLHKTIPMKFDAYYISLLSEKIKKGSYNPFKAFYVGFLSNLKAKKSTEYSSLIYVLKNT